jgi:hypothetical protein
VDFLIGTATPETVIPVSAQAEAWGVPCVLTICPWEQWSLLPVGYQVRPPFVTDGLSASRGTAYHPGG